MMTDKDKVWLIEIAKQLENIHKNAEGITPEILQISTTLINTAIDADVVDDSFPYTEEQFGWWETIHDEIGDMLSTQVESVYWLTPPSCEEEKDEVFPRTPEVEAAQDLFDTGLWALRLLYELSGRFTKEEGR